MSELVVRTASGRSLGVAQWGDPGGRPVFLLHGTPGSRLTGRASDAAWRREGLRAITYDRPGYGLSDRMPGRAVADAASDMAAIADALSIGRFWVSGGSGGAPHALAAAAALPDRVIAARFESGYAPYDAQGLDYFADMDPMNVEEMGLAVAVAEGREAEQRLVEYLQRVADADMERLEKDPSKRLSDDWHLDEADRATLARPEVQQVMLDNTREAYRTGVSGWVDEDLAFVRPWGFDPADIRVPVQVRYGTKGVIVPAAHSAWIAGRVPGATVNADPEAGHFTAPDESAQLLSMWVNTATSSPG